jgi:hypothetical protein
MKPHRFEPCFVSILVVILIAIAANVDAFAVERSVEQSTGWGQYRDKGLGLALDFPSHVFPRKSAEEGREGTVFSTPDGRARIRVFGFINEANDTPRLHLDRIARTDQANFTYIRTAARFFVASGTREGMIFYRRCNFSSSADRRVACLQLDYPQGEKRNWDVMVTRISRSLRIVETDGDDGRGSDSTETTGSSAGDIFRYAP